MAEPSDATENVTLWSSVMERVEVAHKKQAPPKSSDLGGAPGYDCLFEHTSIERMLSAFQRLSGRRAPY